MARGRLARLAALTALTALTILLGAAGCSAPPSETGPLTSTRGYLLVAVDGLRADRLAAWSGDSGPTPALDRLAERGTVFRQAFTPQPDPLPAATSLLTGLLPAEHGVRSPDLRLSRHLATLPERFAERGFLTAGFTTTLWQSPPWGGDRGFDHYASFAVLDTREANAAAVQQALDYLESIEASQRFFAYLQLRVGDPQDPGGDDFVKTDLAAPSSEASSARTTSAPASQAEPTDRTDAAPTPSEASTPPRSPLDDETASRRYDTQLRRLDAELGALFDRLAELGLLAETTVILTAAHGTGLGDPGRAIPDSPDLGRVYPETSRVPLIVAHPEIEPGGRIDHPVQTIDIAATLVAAARLAPEGSLSGIDLAPLIRGESRGAAGLVRVETDGRPRQRALIVGEGGVVLMAVETAWEAETDGSWVTYTTTFDADHHDKAIDIVSFHTPRTVEVRIDGEPADRVEAQTRWRRVPLPGADRRGLRRLTLSTPGCDVPAAVSASIDERCLSFKVRGLRLSQLQLFDLATDPAATVDIGDRRPRRRRELARRLDEGRQRLLLARPEPVPRELWRPREGAVEKSDVEVEGQSMAPATTAAAARGR